MRKIERFVCGLGLFVVCAVLAIGCGSGGSTKQAAVKGSVKVNGVAANRGTVTFHFGSEQISGMIDPQGNYRAVNLPTGEAQVTVEVPNLPKTKVPTTPGMPGVAAGPPVAIPAKYYKVETSGLTHSVTRSESTYDIALEK